MDNSQDNSVLHMRSEIKKFISATFSGCQIHGEFNASQVCWIFKLTFQTTNHHYSIRPPQGCCLMQIDSLADSVTFKIVLFVEDFKKYHAQSILN